MKWISSSEEFDLEFGLTGKKSEINPHEIISRELKREFNSHRNLPYLMQVRHYSIKPMLLLLLFTLFWVGCYT